MAQEFETLYAPASEGPALITKLGMIEGEILSHLETEGPTNVQDLLSRLPWRSESLLMAIGSLIRQGLVRGIQQNTDLLLEQVREQPVPRAGWT